MTFFEITFSAKLRLFRLYCTRFTSPNWPLPSKTVRRPRTGKQTETLDQEQIGQRDLLGLLSELGVVVHDLFLEAAVRGERLRQPHACFRSS